MIEEPAPPIKDTHDCLYTFIITGDAYQMLLLPRLTHSCETVLDYC